MEANATDGYALTYTFGTIGAIAFAKFLAPSLLRQPLYDATKAKIDMIGYQVKKSDSPYASTIQMRAFIVEEGANCIGHSIDALKNRFGYAIQFVNVFRDESAIEISQDDTIIAHDVIVGVLDVTFREDALHARVEHIALVMNMFRKLILQMLKRDTTISDTMSGKRERCAWSFDTAFNILLNVRVS